MNEKYTNGETWYDMQGNILHAHGGHILFHKEYYYWYGENRDGNTYVSCYRSKDLLKWEFRVHSLTTTSPIKSIRQTKNICQASKNADQEVYVSELHYPTKLCLINEDGSKVNLERPKVLYNEKTNKFVMWMHFENGKDYSDAACAVATCDTPDGEFTYHGSFRPFGNMSRDCTLFKDDDGTTYFVSSSRNNADLAFYILQDDYLNVAKQINVAFSNEYREAPAIVKKDGKYYLLTSFCTGWKPNQGGYSVADSMGGVWSAIKCFGDETTYQSQPTFILTINNDIYYVGDRWGGTEWAESNFAADKFDYFKSSYYIAKLNIEGDELSMDSVAYFKPDVSTY